MGANHCVAMVLAGGRGERLGALTSYYAKPAIHFGENSRIIDFTLKNCLHSGLDIIGILTQHLGPGLQAYIDTAYGDSGQRDCLHMLPPESDDDPYTSTTHAVYKNIGFIDRFQPEYVLILAGDHIYSMDYTKLIAFHKETNADVTIASTAVSLEEASRFGILNAHANGRVYEFEEKPSRPKSNLASMGIYVFKWSILKQLLLIDHVNTASHHDFGKDIIPGMLSSNRLIYTYKFNGYWRDVGTLSSLWEANMDMLNHQNGVWTPDEATSKCSAQNYVSDKAIVDRSVISKHCAIYGKIKHSVLADSVTVNKGAEIVDSVVMPGAYIGENVKIYKTIVGINAQILNNTEIGMAEGTGAYIDRLLCKGDISLVAPWVVIPEGMKFKKNSQIWGQIPM